MPRSSNGRQRRRKAGLRTWSPEPSAGVFRLKGLRVCPLVNGFYLAIANEVPAVEGGPTNTTLCRIDRLND